MEKKDFLPAVIVGGIVPECLQGQGYIFRIACDCKDIEAFAPKYESFKEFIIQHPDLDLQQDLLNCFSNDFGVDTQQLPLLNSLSAVGMAWQRYYSYQEYALQDGQDFKAYIRYWQGLLRNMNRLEADYDVSDIVGKLILFYIMSNAYVPISDANGELSIEEVQALQREAGILYNDRFYFIPESLLKKMCQPILETISFLQLKREMAACGMLDCQNLKIQNFTVKKSMRNLATGEIVNKRFVRILKEYLLTEDGMLLEAVAGNSISGTASEEYL